VYVIGTEECERSIAQSALNPSKKTWEAYLNEAIGRNYVPIRSHTLQVSPHCHKRIFRRNIILDENLWLPLT
jgi:hypothetical protein